MTAIASLGDVRAIAKRRLPRIIFDFVDGGAEDERTLTANRAAFQEIFLRPRGLGAPGARELATTVLGQPVELPVLLAPAGAARVVHPAGELAVARAAGAAGTIQVLSTASNSSLEDVMAETAAPKWFQLYMQPTLERTAALVERAKLAGYVALVCTVDTAAIGRRERDIRNGLTFPLKPSPFGAFETLMHPRWVYRTVRSPRAAFEFGNLIVEGKSRGAADFVEAFADPHVTPEIVRWLRDLWDGPLLLKGVLRADEAEAAVACGVDGIIVSNHGGRQLDGAVPAVAALPEIVAAVGDRAEVLLDSGVRRGTDVLKALALGARAVLVGRPWLYGLAAAGEPGVTLVLDMLRNEIVTAMTLTGCRTLSELDPSWLTLPAESR